MQKETFGLLQHNFINSAAFIGFVSNPSFTFKMLCGGKYSRLESLVTRTLFPNEYRYFICDRLQFYHFPYYRPSQVVYDS